MRRSATPLVVAIGLALVANVLARDIAVTQSGEGWTWKMSSTTAGVVDGAGDWPTLTFQAGDKVTFTGKAGTNHWFAIKDSTGKLLVGNPASDNSESGKKFTKQWTAAATGGYEYYCPPHDGGMNGKIQVVEPKPAPVVSGPCVTAHGCCDDKKTAKTDKDGANCAENQQTVGGPCTTEHGCCDDKKTAKTDKDGANCAEIQAAATGDKCKGFGTLADMSLAAPDGELGDAELEKKGAADMDFLAAMLALEAQIKKCESDAACPAAGQCVKAGTDCEPDFIPFMKVTKCGASVIAKTTKAFNRAKAAEAKTAKAEVATAKAAVTSAKAKKAAADEAAAACGDTCAPEVKAAASTAASAYEAAQRTETEAATKASNKAASASNAADAATEADAESASTVAPVVTGNSSTTAPDGDSGASGLAASVAAVLVGAIAAVSF